MIYLEKISKTYGSKRGYQTAALNDITVEFEQGMMHAIIGKSGCGKSTLLNILGGLTRPDSGEYYFNGERLNTSMKAMSSFRRDHIGFIVQNFALINNRSCYENIELAIKNRSADKEKQIKRTAKRLGIYDKLDMFPFEMSGGECQRTAIARALISKPDIILADEPTGALDSNNSMNIINILREIVNSGTTVIIVTHDMTVANNCDKIYKMSDGRIINI
jgi:putative ABC transport system ATP-binding protein